MRRNQSSDQQIGLALEQARSGLSVAEACRKLGISQNIFYRWRRRYGSIEPSEIRRMKELGTWHDVLVARRGTGKDAPTAGVVLTGRVVTFEDWDPLFDQV